MCPEKIYRISKKNTENCPKLSIIECSGNSIIENLQLKGFSYPENLKILKILLLTMDTAHYPIKFLIFIRGAGD